MATQVRAGEPYELAGRRLVFTSWRFVRPGHFGWYDDQGRNVTVQGDQGPWDAHFRIVDNPVGIRLRAQPGRTFADSRPLIGDQPSVPATWRGTDDLGHQDGEAVILRFRLNQAQLFGLEFV